MSYYKQRLQHDASAIREAVHQLGRVVESSITNAVEALLTRNDQLAYETIIADHPVNRAAEHLDRECHYFIAKHLPSGGYLRFISSSLRMIVLLERMGDYASTIARESTQLKVPLTGTFRAEVEAMAADALEMYDRALTAYLDQNEELALETMRLVKQVDRDFSKAFDYLTDQSSEDVDTTGLFARLVVISQLERVSDQAKNICEETVFSITGETKKRRPMKILFFENGPARVAHLAAAIGSRFFSDRGIFTAAGTLSTSHLDETVSSFLDSHGLDGDAITAGHQEWGDNEWSAFDVIICLNGTYGDAISQMPFNTVAFDWWLPEEEDEEEELVAAYRFLRANTEDLITTLRGEEPLNI